MGYISIALILIVLMVIGISVHRINVRQSPAHVNPIGFFISAGALMALIGVTLACSAHQIPTGHVGVVSQFSSIVGQTGEGLQWVRPWATVQQEKVQLASKEFAFDKPENAAASKQSQDVYVRLVLNYRVSPEKILHLHRTVGPQWFETVVAPRVAQVFKAFTVSYDTAEVLPNRETIRAKAASLLKEQLSPYSIEDIDLLILNIGFGKDYQQGIEDTGVQTQVALRERAKIEVKRAEADQAIEAARGEAQAILVNARAKAEANDLLSKSISPTLVQYEMVQRLSDKVSVMMVPPGFGSQVMLPPTALAPRQ